jgi:hypothetical protein
MTNNMGRLYKYLLFALAVAIAIFTADTVRAQTNEPTPTATPSPTNTATAASSQTGTTADITATVPSTAPVIPGIRALATVSATPSVVILPTAAPAASTSITATLPLTSPTQAAVTQTITASEEAGPLEGTIIANRSETDARFFLEGATYVLEVNRSQGIELPRPSTVLNLFNCPADVPVDTAGCFWDPYLLQQNGFYEIYDAESSTSQAKLMLREAGAPPTEQVWIQNRTGQTESIVFKEVVHEIEPTTVLELPVEASVPAIVYVRSCLTIDEQSACEWAPKTLDAGIYYAMIEVDTASTQSGNSHTNIDLRPVVGEGEEAATSEVADAPAIVCNVVVPALNVRSGPGLQYDIIGKVRTTEAEATTVGVTARSADSQWLVVEPSIADQGWINNSPSFIDCTGDVASLPVAEAPAPPPTPVAPPIVESPIVTDEGITVLPEQPAPGGEEGTLAQDTPGVTETTESEVGTTAPDGQAVLVVTNGFQHEMRFTIDQTFRPQQGPSEYDLQPGASVSIVVYPGNVAFTASSPWSGLSGNASIYLNANQSLPLWIRFEPDADGSWVFRWE